MVLKLLLHICCGPCATYPVPFLRKKGHEVCGFFYNPNIHPFTEYRKRKEALEEYAQQQDLKIIYEKEYNPEAYFHCIAYRESRRCFFCYQLRLASAARVAKKGRFEGFSTTLLVSPFQKHELIREVGEEVAEKYGVPFVYYDYRQGFKETVAISEAMGLYRQQYCGCLYSEMERYLPKKRG